VLQDIDYDDYDYDDDDDDDDIFICFNLGWHPVAVVRYTFTHKQYTEHRKKRVSQNTTKWYM
jgi:hypothetical protein